MKNTVYSGIEKLYTKKVAKSDFIALQKNNGKNLLIRNGHIATLIDSDLYDSMFGYKLPRLNDGEALRMTKDHAAEATVIDDNSISAMFNTSDMIPARFTGLYKLLDNGIEAAIIISEDGSNAAAFDRKYFDPVYLQSAACDIQISGFNIIVSSEYDIKTVICGVNVPEIRTPEAVAALVALAG